MDKFTRRKLLLGGLVLGGGPAGLGLIGASTLPSPVQAQSVVNKTELRVGHINDFSALPLFVARSRELFDDEGLDVSLRSYRTLDELEKRPGC